MFDWDNDGDTDSGDWAMSFWLLGDLPWWAWLLITIIAFTIYGLAG